MSEVDDFLKETIPPQVEAEREVHNGNVGPRLEMWSHKDPVTLFGLLRTARRLRGSGEPCRRPRRRVAVSMTNRYRTSEARTHS